MSIQLIERTKADIARFTAHLATTRNKQDAQNDLDAAEAALKHLTREFKRTPDPLLAAHIRQPIDAIDYPKLSEQPAYAETLSVLTRIVNELSVVQGRITELQQQQIGSDFAPVDPLDLLDGGKVGDSISAEIMKLQAKAAILRKTESQYRIRLSYVEADMSGAAVRHATKEHKKRVARVAEALEALREANRQERALVYGIEQLGYTTCQMPFGSYHPNDIDYFDTNGSKGYYFVESIKDYIDK